jgi:hypothetical protein
MARSFRCNTRSPAGNIILGVLFLLCSFGLLAAPCLALAGTFVGTVTPPHNRQELLGTLFAMGVCLALAVVLLALGVLCLNASLLPRTLEITDEGVELRWFTKRLGRVPFANMRGVLVKTRAMAGETTDSAFWSAFFAGGWIAGMMARSRFDPDEPVGLVIKLRDAQDPNTFWPRGIFRRGPRKRLDVHDSWKLPHGQLVEKIGKALARYAR